MIKKIAIASDHGGYALKQFLQENYKGMDVEWVDLGTNSPESVDYPEFGYKLANFIADGKADFGVAICGTGLGISMALNRHPKIRAAVISETTSAALTRQHNDANVLCLGARIVGDVLALDCLDVFLKTEFEGGRHARRVNLLNKTLEGAA